MTIYRKLSFNDAEVQVGSAVCDGLGRQIDKVYAVKAEPEVHIIYTGENPTIQLEHSLNAVPSVVSVFERTGSEGAYSYEPINVLCTADTSNIFLKFAVLPPVGTALKVKVLI